MTTSALRAAPRLPIGLPAAVVRGVAAVVAAIAAWWVYVTVAEVPAYLLPAPAPVGASLAELVRTGALWEHLGATVRTIAIGFVGGVVIGCGVGWLLSLSRLLREIASPYLVVLQAAPKIALAPLLVLWFGLGIESQLALVLMLTFFPMALATQHGLAATPPAMHDLARILGMRSSATLVRIQLPGAMPELFAGAKIAIVEAMTGAFLAEYIAAQQGLGYLMVLGSSSYDTPLLFAAVLLTVATGLAGFGAIALAERHVLRWRTP